VHVRGGFLLQCFNCGFEDEGKAEFCVSCRRYRGPPRPRFIAVSDFQHPDDKEALGILKGTPIIPQLTKKLIDKFEVKRVKADLYKEGFNVREDTQSELYGTVALCSRMLCLSILPQVFIVNQGFNAYTLGTVNDPLLIISSGLIRSANREELLAIIAHEVGHIKCEHMVYHTLLKYLIDGSRLINITSYALNLVVDVLVKDWFKKSELSADRASLLVVGDVKPVRSLLLKFLGWNGIVDPKQFLKKRKSSEDNALGEIKNILSTHPSVSDRLQELGEFFGSKQYNNLRIRMAKNELFRQALK